MRRRRLACRIMGFDQSRNEENLEVLAINEYTLEMRDAPPAHLLTKINSFSLLSQHKIGILESNEFAAGDYNWKVITDLDGGGHISVKLRVVGTESLPAGWEVNAVFNVFLYNHITDKYHCFQAKARRFHAMHSEWEFSKLITKDSLIKPSNGFLFEGKCVLGAEVSVIKKQPLMEKVSVLKLSQSCNGEDPNAKVIASLNTYLLEEINGKRVKNAASLCFGDKFNDRKSHSEEVLEKSAEYSVKTRDASPAHLLTTIKSFSLLSKHMITLLESAVFEAGGYKWKVKINLDGDDDVSVKLSMVGTNSLPPEWEVKAMFNFFLYNHISDKYDCFQGKARRFHAINPEWGFSKLITKRSLTDPCNGYVCDDKCVFGAEVFVTQTPPLIENVSVLRSNPYKLSWNISNFFKREGSWKSNEFTLGGYKWEIMVHPKGDTRANGLYASVFLYCVDATQFGHRKKVYADYALCIRNKRDSEGNKSLPVKHWFSSTYQSCGYYDFIALSELRDPSKGFVVDDCCTVEIQISVIALQELV